MAPSARMSPSAVRTTMPGLLPNLKIFPELGFSSPARAAVADAVSGSPLGGGTRKRETGYAIAAAVDTNPTARSASRKLRRSNAGSVVRCPRSNGKSTGVVGMARLLGDEERDECVHLILRQLGILHRRRARRLCLLAHLVGVREPMADFVGREACADIVQFALLVPFAGDRVAHGAFLRREERAAFLNGVLRRNRPRHADQTTARDNH